MSKTYSIVIGTDETFGEVEVNASSEDEALALAEINWEDGKYPEISGSEVVFIVPSSSGCEW